MYACMLGTIYDIKKIVPIDYRCNVLIHTTLVISRHPIHVMTIYKVVHDCPGLHVYLYSAYSKHDTN